MKMFVIGCSLTVAFSTSFVGNANAAILYSNAVTVSTSGAAEQPHPMAAATTVTTGPETVTTTSNPWELPSLNGSPKAGNHIPEPSTLVGASPLLLPVLAGLWHARRSRR